MNLIPRLHAALSTRRYNKQLRGIKEAQTVSDPPSAECICGGVLFNALVTFDPDDYTIATYLFAATCAECGRDITLPCEIEHPDYEGEPWNA